MHIAQINYVYDPALVDPDALLDRYATLTGWSDALLAAGATAATVVQRFTRDATIARAGVTYVFVKERGGGAPASWRAASRVHRAAVSSGADVLHVNGLNYPLQMIALRRAAPTHAIVVQDHASGDPPAYARGASRGVRVTVWRRALTTADAFFFTAARQAESWTRAGLISTSQPVFEILESSTDITAVPRGEAARASGIGGTPAMLWVGRLNANKDPLTVLDGFERTASALPLAQLTMVFSDGDLEAAVRSRVAQSPALRDRVRLAGAVPHARIGAFFSAADLFVLGSHHEGSGYALIEACASGAVPVVTRIPAFDAITGGGSIGGLWRVGDAADCARALVDVASRDIAAERTRVRARFDAALSWNAVGACALRAYGDVLARARARARA
jgi:glycosyltransferase involved in cell wall biosynthesis